MNSDLLTYRSARAALRSGKVVQERFRSPEDATIPTCTQWRRVREVPLSSRDLCGYEWRLKPGQAPAKKQYGKGYIHRAAALIRRAMVDGLVTVDPTWNGDAAQLLKEIGK